MSTIVTHPVRLAAALSVAASAVGAQEPSSSAPAAQAIRLSQIGFLPAAPKIAVVVGATGPTFAVVGAARGDTVLRGTLTPPKPWALSGEENVRRADFSRLARPGRYRLVVAGG